MKIVSLFFTMVAHERFHRNVLLSERGKTCISVCKYTLSFIGAEKARDNYKLEYFEPTPCTLAT